jgi:hypothetical protein
VRAAEGATAPADAAFAPRLPDTPRQAKAVSRPLDPLGSLPPHSIGSSLETDYFAFPVSQMRTGEFGPAVRIDLPSADQSTL